MIGMSILLRFAILSIIIKITLQNFAYSQHAVRSEDVPTTSCTRITAKSTVHCFQTCIMSQTEFYMFSYNKNDQSCVCCMDRKGSKLTGDWKSYIPPPCPGGYTPYLYEYFMICLKYVAMDKKYSDAFKHCDNDGGDLIRLDSLKKFQMFEAHLGPYAAKNPIQVWVQSEEHETEWKFCPISQSNVVKGNHLRYQSHNNECSDAPPSDTHHYVCEIYRRFSHPH